MIEFADVAKFNKRHGRSLQSCGSLTVPAATTATKTTAITPAPASATFAPTGAHASRTSSAGPHPAHGVTAGGPVNVDYLGGGCSGFASSAPTFSVNYTAGAFPTLRFYFIGSADTTIVVNSPSGSFFCVDDSFGGPNPTIDFNSPAGGRYDVWIGTAAAGASIGGSFFVTESTGNHP